MRSVAWAVGIGRGVGRNIASQLGDSYPLAKPPGEPRRFVSGDNDEPKRLEKIRHAPASLTRNAERSAIVASEELVSYRLSHVHLEAAA
jgi:hypothetical protein